MFAAADEPTKALAQPDLRLPAEILHRFRERVDPGLHVLGDLGRMAIGPRPLDQRPPRAAVARLRDPALAARRPVRVLGWNQADERRQLPRRREPGEVAELRDDGEGDELSAPPATMYSMDLGEMMC